MPFGYVIDFACGPKQALGGTLEAPTRVASGAMLVIDESCQACIVAAGDGPGCIGVLPTPLSSQAEHWLFGRLPDSLETVSGQMLKLSVAAGSTGDRGNALREARELEGRESLKRSWGAVLRRFTVSTDQLLEQLLCVGDIEPPHAMAQLIQLGVLAIDGKVPVEEEEGAVLSQLMEHPATRSKRTTCTVEVEPEDEPGVVELKRFVRAMYAAFCVDCKLLVFKS